MADKTGYFFENDAAEYETHIYSHVGCDDELYQQTAKALALKGASLLLDLWCGTGRELDEIMKLSPWVSVTGMDVSPTLLAKLLAKPYASRLTLVNCRSLTTPFGTGTFDAAVAVMAMHHFADEDRLAIYRKVLEALRPGGRYVETDLVARDDGEAAAYLDRWRPGDAARCERPVTAERIETLLREAGFVSVARRWERDAQAIFVAGKDRK